MLDRHYELVQEKLREARAKLGLIEAWASEDDFSDKYYAAGYAEARRRVRAILTNTQKGEPFICTFCKKPGIFGADCAEPRHYNCYDAPDDESAQ